ncbi:ankyrin [Agrocybe pediades]|nr:ankyrin [Agrocybe pediades]
MADNNNDDAPTKGADNNQRLLAAARDDNEELLIEIFEAGDFDINCQDGLGNTPLHNAVMHGSTDVLEHILSHDECDVDPINRTDRATPLHLAAQIQHVDLRLHIFESLLDAGADLTIKDKNGETPLDLIPPNDAKLAALIRKHKMQASVQQEDVVSDEDAGPGSRSGSDED